MTEVDVLAASLRERFGDVVVRSDFGWPRRPALCVVDCVLSLNRKYRSMVLPRVTALSDHRPDLVSIGQLRALIDSYDSPLSFMRSELDYDDAKRAATLGDLVDYVLTLIDTGREGEEEDEWSTLSTWAADAHPGDYLAVQVKGFGLAGFQYLRMLFGVQTTKPDVHIIRYVSDVVGRQVNDVAALMLLEAAAESVRLPLREVDGAIWNAAAAPASSAASS